MKIVKMIAMNTRLHTVFGFSWLLSCKRGGLEHHYLYSGIVMSPKEFLKTCVDIATIGFK